ncbi:DUF2127 domain-containing protein [Tundrisphaera sp. TA3]|uniref:DUF2127 domain-containing protein n=1 Tax=Tundrisphaera sp. TA3 TaxID=3435775 RepID=UPI003EC118DA
MSPRNGSSHFGLYLIGGFKVASAILLAALGVGLLHSIHSDLATAATRLVAWIKLDPDNRYIHEAITKVSGIQPKQLRVIGGGTILYALTYAIEGVGLLLRKPWAEYLTVVLTGIFIPLECYEVIHKLTAPRATVLILNVAIVAYLISVVWKRRREEKVEVGAMTAPAA